jgi:Cytochrome bd terminal oxidase subunit I
MPLIVRGRLSLVNALELARWQFGITTVYHFLFVPLTIGLAPLVAILQTAWVRTGKPCVVPGDEVLRQALADQLRARGGDLDRSGVPVRDELERLLTFRG